MRPSTIKADRPVDFRLVSRDVQHGFGVYKGNELVFQVQVPAKDQPEQRYVTSFDEPGTYEINCLEFCGFQHHEMTAHGLGTFVAWAGFAVKRTRSESQYP